MGGMGKLTSLRQSLVRILTFAGQAFQLLRVGSEDRAFRQMCECMAMIGKDIQCIGVQYYGSLAMFQLLYQGSFCFLVPPQSRTYADCW